MPNIPRLRLFVLIFRIIAFLEEQEKRLAEYQNKFDLTKLTWNTAGKGPDGKALNYGSTARNYLYWAPGDFGGVQKRNYIHVFAFEGDTICFGSNVYNSTLNQAGTAKPSAGEQDEIHKRLGKDATVDIVMTDLRGNRILYDVKQNGAGHIKDVYTEVLAKTMESPDGNSAAKLRATFPDASIGSGSGLDKHTYTPLKYEVTETGVYTFEFHSYSYVGGTDGRTNKNDEDFHSEKELSGGLVAAWDISVFNEQGHKETGRVYADYLSFEQTGTTVETYYVVTTDSYIYRWDWNGNRPNTYNFFADNKGLTDNATGSTLYKSVKEIKNANFDYTRFGASFKYPGSANTDESKSYYIFFEEPNPDLEGHLYKKAIQPDPAENIRFMDRIIDPETKTEVTGSYVGMGGYFAFDTKEATTATLVLDFTKLKNGEGESVDGSEKYAPVTISGPVKPYSTNYFYWDGKDGKGTVIPVGTYNIQDVLTLTTKAGEIHFPVHDVESATGGFTFTRVSPIYDREGNQVDGKNNILDATRNVIYYDDSAIYYGEHVGRTGLAESEVEKYKNDVSTAMTTDDMGKKYYRYANMKENTGGEYKARQTQYIKDNIAATTEDKAEYIRIGDHSHVTNQIKYYDGKGVFGKMEIWQRAPKM